MPIYSVSIIRNVQHYLVKHHATAGLSKQAAQRRNGHNACNFTYDWLCVFFLIGNILLKCKVQCPPLKKKINIHHWLLKQGVYQEGFGF